jgi:broad specificity phosphatase PhoE
MQVYLVRHGESEGNAQSIHQDARVGLSARGIQQARSLAQRFAAASIDAIVSSPFERALQTATFIGETIHKPVSVSPLLVEIKRPTEIEGRPMEDADVVAIKNRILQNWHDPDWRHSDEETFFDLRARAIEALRFITGQPWDTVLIVTHGQFMRLLVCVMAFGPTVGPDVFTQLQSFLMMSNTGITRCENGPGQWKLITWNERTDLQ